VAIRDDLPIACERQRTTHVQPIQGEIDGAREVLKPKLPFGQHLNELRPRSTSFRVSSLSIALGMMFAPSPAYRLRHPIEASMAPSPFSCPIPRRQNISVLRKDRG
jgi:hypothetical protein